MKISRSRLNGIFVVSLAALWSGCGTGGESPAEDAKGEPVKVDVSGGEADVADAPTLTDSKEPVDRGAADTPGPDEADVVDVAADAPDVEPACTEGDEEPCEQSNEHGTCEGKIICLGERGLAPCDARTPAAETCNALDDDCDGETDEDIDLCDCGDGVCAAEGGEDLYSCPCDCKVCGDDFCSPCGEGPESCPVDCCRTPEGPNECGDGYCLGYGCGETPAECPEDCDKDCGNGICDVGEAPYACPDDCKRDECGNGVCEPTDGGPAACPEDCAPGCGDCVCERGESWRRCPVDCSFCGDGVCNRCPGREEHEDTCPDDCCVPVATDDSICDGKDDDCDGETDEDFSELDEPCDGDDEDSCANGTWTCAPGGAGLVCENERVVGLVELCNGSDDDCDGETDEGLTGFCGCGDDSCDAAAGEDLSTCPCDCAECGDGVCSPCGESFVLCPEDCCLSPTGSSSCGDGYCLGYACGETRDLCPEDCGESCGDGTCDPGESPVSCFEDCKRELCGNGVCEGSDGGPEGCPADCGARCGNCTCEAAQGETAQTCPFDCGFCGDRVCSPCKALRESPATCMLDCCVVDVEGWERCDGIDNDCDGETDEGVADPGGPCDDLDPCTHDACDRAAGCTHKPAHGVACDDADPCTYNDLCEEGVCRGTLRDGPCCSHDRDCPDDGDPCNGVFFCDKSSADPAEHRCVVDPESVVTCEGEGEDFCRPLRCDPATGSCVVMDLPDGTPCPSDDLCAPTATCHEGLCRAFPRICRDFHPCTADACDPATGACVNEVEVGCLVEGEGCVAAGVLSSTVPCGACRPDLDRRAWSPAPEGSACDDGDPCTVSACDAAGACAAELVDCDDGNPCTTDTCERERGCVHEAVAGDGCCATAEDCDDSNPCTADACGSEKRCEHSFNEELCDDGDLCTTPDTCEGGACVPGALKDCDDADACTVDSCDAETGDCAHDTGAADGQSCDDGVDCTGPDLCDGGLCVGSDLECDRVAPEAPVFTGSLPGSPSGTVTTPALQGTAEPESTVTVYGSADCSDEALAAVIAGPEGGFSAPVSVDPNSGPTFHATATDRAGNTSPCSEGLTYVHDDMPPEAPALGVIIPASPSTETRPSVTGSTEPLAEVWLYALAGCGGASIGSGEAGADGTFEIYVAIPLNRATTVHGASVDAAGNRSACTSAGPTYTHDDIAPPAPSLTRSSPASPAGYTTTPKVYGTAEAGTTVGIFETGGCTGDALLFARAGPDGDFEATVTVDTNSTTTFHAAATDAAGNTSLCSDGFAFSHDALAPEPPVLVSTTPPSPSRSTLTPLIHGQAEPGSAVTLFGDSLCRIPELGDGVADEAGTFSIRITVPTDSETLVFATARDAAGNLSRCSDTSVSYVHSDTATDAPELLGFVPPSPSPTETEPIIEGTAWPDSTVKIYDRADCGGDPVVTTDSGPEGSFSAEVSVAENSSKTFYATTTDREDNTSICSAGLTYEHDDIAPAAPALEGTAPPSPSPDRAPAVLGEAEPRATVLFYAASDCSGTPLATGSAGEEGSFGVPVPVPPDETSAVFAKAVDAAGNHSPCSAEGVTYTNDSTAPPKPILSATSPESPSRDTTNPEVSGTAEPSSLVRVYKISSCRGAPVATATAAEDGSFSVEVEVAENFENNFYASAEDQAGNRSGCTWPGIAFTHDSRPPPAPVFTSVVPTSPAREIAPTVTGSAERGATVEVFLGAECEGTPVASTTTKTGTFAMDITVPADAEAVIHARAVDEAGNVSACSGALRYVHDGTPPDAPTLTGTNPSSPSQDVAPAVNGKTDPGSVVKVYLTSLCSGPAAGSTVAAGDGSFSVQAPAAVNATTSYHAAAIDAAGNVSECSPPLLYRHDDIAPGPPSLESVTPESPHNENMRPVLRGSAEAGATVVVYGDLKCVGARLGEGVAPDGPPGQDQPFTVQVFIAPNSTTHFRAVAIDRAGNESECSDSTASYSHDSIPPGTPSLTGTTPTSPSSTDHAPLIHGSAEPLAEVHLYAESGCRGEELASGLAGGDGSFSIEITVEPNTETEIFASATDPAGNPSPCTRASLTYIYDGDTLPPTITGSSPPSPSRSSATPYLLGTAEPGSTVSVYTSEICAGAVVGTAEAGDMGDFSVTVAAVANAETTFYANAKDNAGNISGCSKGFTFVHDDIPPLGPTLDSITPESPSSDPKPTVTGTAEPGVNVLLYGASDCSGQPMGSAVADEQGRYSVSADVPNDATIHIHALARDDAGNRSDCSADYFAYTHDGSAPSAPIILYSTPESPTNETTSPVISGFAVRWLTVNIYQSDDCSGEALASTFSDDWNQFSVPVPVQPNATTTLYASTSDDAGNTSPCSEEGFLFTHDDTPPRIPILTGTTPRTPNPTLFPVVHGSTEEGASVKIFLNESCGGRSAGRGDAEDGTFAIETEVRENEANLLYAAATDSVGNVSDCSSGIPYTHDDIAPDAPIWTGTDPVSPDPASTSPDLHGTAEAGTTVQLHGAEDCSDPSQAEVTSAGEGVFTFGVTVPANSTTVYYATVTDPAGNLSTCGEVISYTHDDIPPSAPSVVALDPPSPGNDRTPTVSGSAEAGAAVVIYGSASCAGPKLGEGAAAAGDTGTQQAFAVDANAAESVTTTFHADATDAAGNTSACSQPALPYLHDGIAPEPPVLSHTTPATLPANVQDPLLSGTAEDGAAIEVFLTPDCAGTSIGTGTAAGGSFSVSVTVPADTASTLYAAATDAARNTSTCSAGVPYTHDGIAPVVPVLTGTDPASPSRNPNLTLQGSTEAAATVEAYFSSDCSGAPAGSGAAGGNGAFALSVSVPHDATTELRTTATDAAGNVSACSAPVPYRHDDTPPGLPVLAVTDPSSGGASVTPTIGGSTEAESSVALYTSAGCTGDPVATGSTGADGSFSTKATVVVGAATSFYASATDAVGLQSGCTADPLVYEQAPVCGDGACAGSESRTSCATDCAPPDGFVLVPAGQFAMGLSAAAQRQVKITRAFWLKAHEVTQSDWQLLMGGNPSAFPSCGNDCPVEQVGWWDALAYCNALSTSEGLPECYELSGCSQDGSTGQVTCTGVVANKLCAGYRLPTEAEWEYAARAGETTTFDERCSRSSAGSCNDSSLDPVAWYLNNSIVGYPDSRSCPGVNCMDLPACGTFSVGARNANAWGFYDMSGNVEEWVWDWYSASYYSTRTDPDVDPFGPSSGTTRGVRGGFFGSRPSQCCLGARSYALPSARQDSVGFRPARTVDIEPTATPSLSSITPSSPSPQRSVQLRGSAVSLAGVEVFADGACAGSPVASGSAGTGGSFTVQHTVPANVATTFSVRARDAHGIPSECATNALTYVHDDIPPAPPVIVGTDPASPGVSSVPAMTGTAEAGSTVSVYASPGCGGGVVASGTADGQGSFSVPVKVALESVSSFFARATDAAGNVSGCSASGADYVQVVGCGDSACVGGETLESCPEDCGVLGFVKVESGDFVMGTTNAEPGSDVDEWPQRDVRISRAFWMHATEVTQGQWLDIMGTSPSASSACGADCPVERVSWWDVLAYCNELSRSEGLQECYSLSGCSGSVGSGCGAGQSGCTGSYYCSSMSFAGLDCDGYRLPTEAEWEYAVRAGTDTAFYNGAITVAAQTCSLDANLDAIGWYCGNSGNQTHAVGGKTANAWGLYDMSGNVWEWVADAYDSSYYQDRVDALAGATDVDPRGPAVGQGVPIVFRGGSCCDGYARGCRSANRSSETLRHRDRYRGFRPVRTADVDAPSRPILTARTPDSPSPERDVEVSGTAEAGSVVELYAAAGCSGEVVALVEVGTNGQWTLSHEVDPNTETTFTATATDDFGNTSPCSSTSLSYVHDDIPPDRPILTTTDPETPDESTRPVVSGTAEAGASVRLHTRSSCSGGLAATGAADGSGAFSLQVTVGAPSTTTFYATATDAAGNRSSCSTSSITYVQETCGNGSCVGGETPGVCPRDCPLSGYVHVPAGQSVMGAPSDEPGYAADEGPQRRVTLSHGFLLKATEVTQAEWTALMGNAPSSFSACGDDCPVENVNWWEALAYCNALSEAEGLPSCYTLTGCGATSPGEGMTCTGVSVTAAGGDPLLCKGYRLPTEAEWEHAVRSGTETATYQGPLTVQGERDAPELDAIAWYGGNSGVSYAGGTDCSSWTGTADPASTCGTHPVGQKTANGWGLYDMVGNVSEWVWDWYGGSHYGTRPDPDSDPPGPASGSQRGLRGGAWLSVVADSRSAARDSGAPSSAADHVGFRPARSVIKTLSCTNDSDCDDGNICSADDCSSGVCTHAPYGCDDSDPCTVGSCFAATCNYTPTDCDDGLSCTVDSCDAQGCRHDPYICDDGDACTDDYCEEPNRTCSAAPSATLGQPCDGTDSDQCANGTYTCKADRSGFECTNEAPSDIAETCDGTDEDCDGVTDNGFEKDTSHSGDFPDSWSTNLPEVARYATTTSGTISGHILPSGDSDWFSIRATEDDTRRCSQTGWSDVRIKGDVTFTAPADASLRVCACFSSSSSKCSRSGTDCSTVAAGSSVDLAVEVNNMSCWSTDTAYLDIEVSAPSGPGWSCTDWRVDWVISE